MSRMRSPGELSGREKGNEPGVKVGKGNKHSVRKNNISRRADQERKEEALWTGPHNDAKTCKKEECIRNTKGDQTRLRSFANLSPATKGFGLGSRFPSLGGKRLRIGTLGIEKHGGDLRV